MNASGRGRVIARCFVVRAKDGLKPQAYLGRPTPFDARTVVYDARLAAEFTSADEAREEIGRRVLLGRARRGFWKVYRRGRRQGAGARGSK